MGFCRTNLFKRLESSGQAFLQSVERHVLRNFIFLHAIEHDLPLADRHAGRRVCSTQASTTRTWTTRLLMPNCSRTTATRRRHAADGCCSCDTEADFARARQPRSIRDYADAVQAAASVAASRPLRAVSSPRTCSDDAASSAEVLTRLRRLGPDPRREARRALRSAHARSTRTRRSFVFTQFADTVRYLDAQLQRPRPQADRRRHRRHRRPDRACLALQPGQQRQARRSPRRTEELRVLIATDVLSEGQNLQDARSRRQLRPALGHHPPDPARRPRRPHRPAGREDPLLLVPAGRRRRAHHPPARPRAPAAQENAEVVGTDEAFFEDERERPDAPRPLPRESRHPRRRRRHRGRPRLLRLPDLEERHRPLTRALQKIIPELPPVVYSTKPHQPTARQARRRARLSAHRRGQRRLAWVDSGRQQRHRVAVRDPQGRRVRADTPALPRHEHHHDLVRKGVEHDRRRGEVRRRPTRPAVRRALPHLRAAQALRRAGARARSSTSPSSRKAIEEIYRYPLRQSATDTLNRQLRAGIADDKLAELVMALRDEDRLCIIHEEEQTHEPQIICSLGLAPGNAEMQ